ncbi:hypothetical protein F5Y11DRAFT_11298 [Daldinia sp. FL1419]|nr:hypothetical protein F5Y11DRAFT_11298 [Daldinia sp. FL1419]
MENSAPNSSNLDPTAGWWYPTGAEATGTQATGTQATGAQSIGARAIGAWTTSARATNTRTTNTRATSTQVTRTQVNRTQVNRTQATNTRATRTHATSPQATRGQATIVSDRCILVNVEALNQVNRVSEFEPHSAVSYATEMLEVGIDQHHILTVPELRRHLGTFARSLPRPYDLSRNLMKVANIRRDLQGAICFNGPLTGAQAPGLANTDTMQPNQVAVAIRVVNFLNDLIKRILLAERTGEFITKFHTAEFNKRVWKTDTTLSQLESEASQHLETLKRANVMNGTRRPHRPPPGGMGQMSHF